MRRSILVFFTFIIIIFTGCRKEELFFTTTLSHIDFDNHIEKLHEYDSPYTACYQNKDGTYTFYIFAAPVQYKEGGNYHVIDNSLIDSHYNGFAYENKANSIKTYFPQTLMDCLRIEDGENYLEFRPCLEDENVGEAKLTAYTNIYGDTVNAVIYEGEDSDMIFYPTRAGIKSEMVFHNGYKENKVQFIVYSNAINYRNKENGYITFEKGGKSQSIIYQPLVQYSTQKDGAFGVDTEMKIRKEGDGFVVEMLFDGKTNTQTVVKMDPSFELYLNKMPDTSVYSRFNKNSYLRHYAVVGEHPELGEGWEFIRLRINYFMTLNPGALLDASYNIRVLASSNPSYALTAYEAEEQWSSTGLLWSNKRQPQSIFATAKGKHAQYISFNMKDYVAECLQDPDWLKESVGFILKQDNAGYTILASSDNVLYSPYLKMTLKDLPVYFDAQDNINETQY